jgi:hypothetical protein
MNLDVESSHQPVNSALAPLVALFIGFTDAVLALGKHIDTPRLRIIFSFAGSVLVSGRELLLL